jgi:hypothetical protein
MSTKQIFSLIDVDPFIIRYIIDNKLIFKINLVIATHASWIPSQVFFDYDFFFFIKKKKKEIIMKSLFSPYITLSYPKIRNVITELDNKQEFHHICQAYHKA